MARRRPLPTVTIRGRSGRYQVSRKAVNLVRQSDTPRDFIRLAFPRGVTKPAARRAKQLYALVRTELERVPDSRLEAA